MASLGTRLAEIGCEPEIVKCALTRDDVDRYGLPPNPTKKTDSRGAAFVAEHGDISVELDALPVDVLRQRIARDVEARMDMPALTRVRKTEERERRRIAKLLGA